MNQLYKFLKLSDIPIFSANFICMFKMDYYPFDTQVKLCLVMRYNNQQESRKKVICSFVYTQPST